MLRSSSEGSNPLQLEEDSKTLIAILNILSGKETFLENTFEEYERILNAVDKYNFLHVENYMKLAVHKMIANDESSARTAFVLATKLDDLKLAKRCLSLLPTADRPLSWEPELVKAMGLGYYFGVMRALNKCYPNYSRSGTFEWKEVAAELAPF
jgi:hypothetical protein